MNEMPAPSATAETIRSSSGSIAGQRRPWRLAADLAADLAPGARAVRLGPPHERLAVEVARADGRAPGQAVARGAGRRPSARARAAAPRARDPRAAGGRTPTSISPACSCSTWSIVVPRLSDELDVRVLRRGRRRRSRRRSPPVNERVRLMRRRPRSPRAGRARDRDAARSARLSSSRASASSALPGRRQRGTPAVALEQRHPELGLERADLLADARLRQVQPLGGAAEVKLLGDRDERAQLAELHPAAMIGAAFHRREFPS